MLGQAIKLYFIVVTVAVIAVMYDTTPWYHEDGIAGESAPVPLEGYLWKGLDRLGEGVKERLRAWDIPIWRFHDAGIQYALGGVDQALTYFSGKENTVSTDLYGVAKEEAHNNCMKAAANVNAAYTWLEDAVLGTTRWSLFGVEIPRGRGLLKEDNVLRACNPLGR